MRPLSNRNGEPSPAVPADPEDFQAFVVSRGAHLYRTACLLTGGDTHLAEDLVQETLGRMYTKWGRRPRIDNPAGYAQTTMVNAFISMRRRKSSGERPTEVVRDVADSDAGAGARGGAGSAPDLDLRLTLIDALRELTEVDRAVLVLRFWEDRSVEETAAALKLSSGAVRSRCSRALARVRELLGADFIEFAEN